MKTYSRLLQEHSQAIGREAELLLCPSCRMVTPGFVASSGFTLPLLLPNPLADESIFECLVR